MTTPSDAYSSNGIDRIKLFLLTDIIIFLRLFNNNQRVNMTKAMKEQDRTIVLELKKRLSADLQKRVIKFILYGSRARGVDADDSDLDLVALVDEKTPEIESALDDLAYGVMWDYDFKPVISLKVFSEARFRNSMKKGMSFYRHVEKEGISL